MSSARCWHTELFVFMQAQGSVPCEAGLCKHRDCWRGAEGASPAGMERGASPAGMEMSRSESVSLRGVSPPGLSQSPGRFPGRALVLLCAGRSSRHTGRAARAQARDSLLAVLTPTEGAFHGGHGEAGYKNGICAWNVCRVAAHRGCGHQTCLQVVCADNVLSPCG